MNVNDWLIESYFYLDTRICRPSTGRRCFPLGFACCRTTAAPLLSVVAVVRLPEGIEGLGPFISARAALPLSSARVLFLFRISIPIVLTFGFALFRFSAKSPVRDDGD